KAGKASNGAGAARLFTDYSHETFTCWLIEELFRQETIRELLSRPNAAIKLDDDVKAGIPALAIGKASGSLAPFNSLISGDFDADRIDYLIRDNRRSGFAIGLSLD